MSIDEATLNRYRKATEAVTTPGPWDTGDPDSPHVVWSDAGTHPGHDVAHVYNDGDAAFIAIAREAMPALLAEVGRLKGRLRKTAQILIEEVGADGPMNAEDAAARAVRVLGEREEEVEGLRALLRAVAPDAQPNRKD